MNVKKVFVVGVFLLLSAPIVAANGKTVKMKAAKAKPAKKVKAPKNNVKAQKIVAKSKKPSQPKSPKPAPQKWKKPQMAGFYTTAEYGVMKYNKPKDRALTDANGNADKITITKTSPVLLIGGGAGLEFSGIRSWGDNSEGRARLGVATSFAKKNDAIQGDYFDTDQTTALLATLQDIKRFEGLVVGNYELWNGYGMSYLVDAGLGFVVGGMRDLRIQEKDGDALYYTGQRFVAKKARVTGRIGASLEKQAGRFTLGTGFRVGFSKQEFQDYIVVEEPAQSAAVSHHNAYANLKALSARKGITFTPPTFKVRSYEFRISACVDF